MLALGIGISRVASQGGEGRAVGGFGVVTLASALPILTVMGLGLFFLPNLPQPTSDVEFCSPANRDKALYLFADEQAMKGYTLRNGTPEARRAFFGCDTGALDDYIAELAGDEQAQATIFGSAVAFDRWLLTSGSPGQRLRVYGSEERIREKAEALYAVRAGQLDVVELLSRKGLGALQAIVPLSIFLILVLLVVLREKIRRADEIALGVLFDQETAGFIAIKPVTVACTHRGAHR